MAVVAHASQRSQGSASEERTRKRRKLIAAAERELDRIVAPARRSPAARAKALRKRTPDQLPVQSFTDWLRDSATIVKTRIEPKRKTIAAFARITRPKEAPRRALEWLQVSL